MTRKKRGKQPIGQNGAQLSNIGITLPKIPNFFIEACLWAVFVSHGVPVDRSFVVAQEASACIAPYQTCKSGNVQDSLHELIERNIFKLERVVCCALQPDSLSTIVKTLQRRSVHVYIHDASTTHIVVKKDASTYVMLCVHNGVKHACLFSSSDGVRDRIEQTSTEPWVYICDIRV